MKLSKKHIGQLFDCEGGDGSWCWLLLDVKGKDLLFYSMSGKFWIDNNKYGDWRRFSGDVAVGQSWTDKGWKQAKKS